MSRPNSPGPRSRRPCWRCSNDYPGSGSIRGPNNPDSRRPGSRDNGDRLTSCSERACGVQPPRARAARRLQGRIAIVTGAGSRPSGNGAGKAISVLFACAGATVAVVDLDEERALATIAEIETLGGDAFAVLGDVASSADSKRIVADVLSRCGRLEVLVNNVFVVLALLPRTRCQTRPGTPFSPRISEA